MISRFQIKSPWCGNLHKRSGHAVKTCSSKIKGKNVVSFNAPRFKSISSHMLFSNYLQCLQILSQTERLPATYPWWSPASHRNLCSGWQTIRVVTDCPPTPAQLLSTNVIKKTTLSTGRIPRHLFQIWSVGPNKAVLYNTCADFTWPAWAS